jgi:hypothetical protein
MANQFQYNDYPSLVEYLTTDLNSIADGVSVIGAAIDCQLYTNMVVALQLAEQGIARSSGAYVSLYAIPSIDGTNYSYGSASLMPSSTHRIRSFELDATVTARYVISPSITLLPGYYKLLVTNKTGQAFAASGNKLSYGIYCFEMQ